MGAIGSLARGVEKRFSGFAMRTMKRTTARDAKRAERFSRIAVCPGYWDRIGRARSKNSRPSSVARGNELNPNWKDHLVALHLTSAEAFHYSGTSRTPSEARTIWMSGLRPVSSLVAAGDRGLKLFHHAAAHQADGAAAESATRLAASSRSRSKIAEIVCPERRVWSLSSRFHIHLRHRLISLVDQIHCLFGSRD